jgi:hypothetical protein
MSIDRMGSNPAIRALRIHRKSVLHYFVSDNHLILNVLWLNSHLRRTVIGDTKVENRIGDAIVARAIRAHHEGTPWKCCILIPLLPGFTFPVDHSDASAVGPQLYSLQLRYN